MEITFYSLHPVELNKEVSAWVLYMKTQDPRCGKNTALGEVLALVESKLLAVNEDSRFQAKNMFESIQAIEKKAKEDVSYRFQGPSTFPPPPYTLPNQLSLSPSSAGDASGTRSRPVSSPQINVPAVVSENHAEHDNSGQIPGIPGISVTTPEEANQLVQASPLSSSVTLITDN